MQFGYCLMEERKEGENIFTDELLEKVRNLPKQPGIYMYKNASGKIIYVGKAKDLRNRVKSYFQNNRPFDAKTKALVQKIDDLEYFITSSEAEALILENNLIKKHKPKYNILLRDDKTYPYIRITFEEFPRIYKTRKIIKDGSKYFGPYTEVRTMKYMLKFLRTVFKFRTCKLALTEKTIQSGKYKICLDYHIKKCTGPCENHISKKDYNDNIKSAISIIQGKTKELEAELRAKMLKYSEDMEFEKAADLRNQLSMLTEYTGSQKVITQELIDRDVIGISNFDNNACTIILMIREGKLIGKKHFIIQNSAYLSTEELVQATIEKWYMQTEFIPREILLPAVPEQPEFILDWLKTKRKKTVELIEPKIGEKKKIVDLASANADFMLRDYYIAIAKKDQTISKTMLNMQKDLKMQKPPIRIECFDNSHLQGTDYVSSMVVFIEGKPKKSEYRKYKLEQINGNDDFAAMREVIHRRYEPLKENPDDMPDLIIIDGGKGQLSSAIEILKELELFDKTAVIGLAKRLDEIFFPFQSDSVLLPRTSSSLRIIQQLRDEAHRFAITYHRQLRSKRTLKSELTDIKGIGKKTSEKLLQAFGSVENIKTKSKEDLEKEISVKISDIIYNYFHNLENA